MNMTNRAGENESLKAGVLHHRAMEAVVWAMPRMNYKANRDGHFANSGDYNNVFYYSKMQSWKFQLATPNDTTPYINAFWNTENGPVVIEIPAATSEVGVFGTLMDSWHRPLEDVGPKGADKGRGAKYLLLPPGYTDEVPDGNIVINQQTYQGWFCFRPIIPDSSQKSVDIAANYVKDLKVYYLNAPTETRYIDLSGKLVESISVFDDTYFDHLNEMVQSEPIEEKDQVMMGMLKSLGIKKGEAFNPSPEQRKILAAAAKDAHDYMLDMYHNVLLPPYYAGKHWTNIVNESVMETGFTFQYPTYLDLDNRGAAYYAVTTSVKNFGAATFYISGAKDNKGEYLDGGKMYHLKVAANVPARDFWSAVAYNLDTAAWIRDVPKVGVSSKNPDIQINEDGTTDLYFGPEAPEGMESNWVPTRAGERFFLLFRFYGPEPAVFDKSWQLDDIKLAD
jgi:hypothetical protein